MIFDIFKIAFRNVLRNKRRSILNILSFSVCVLTILYGFGLLKGQFDAMFEKMINIKAGHLKIYNKNFTDEKRTLPLDLNIKNPQEVINAIKGIPHFKYASPRILHPGIVSNGRKKVNVIIHGVDFDTEKNIVITFNSINGDMPSMDSAQVLIGKKLADILEIKKGDNILLYSQTLYNANNLVDATISGLYSIGFDAMEKIDFYIPYNFAQEFFDMKDKATEIIVRLDKTENVQVAKKYIDDIIKRKFPELVVLDWKEENPELIETARVKYRTFSFMAMILLFLSFFIIMNTMTMSVIERTPEIGTLRAIGFNRNQILMMFLSEAFLLSVFGAIVGFIISAPLIYYLNVYGIQLDPQAYTGYNLPMDSSIKAINRFTDWIYAVIICVVAGISGAILPAIRASRINIVKSLQKGVR
ncbi:MAG: FtsX-like permease family protein [Candidatus Goldbacteria bacterium]|nr:FtsX-like permease family protein [Candidatus Goldiibacteriota bacterium]